jgi:hypothetical protein
MIPFPGRLRQWWQLLVHWKKEFAVLRIHATAAVTMNTRKTGQPLIRDVQVRIGR